MQSIAVLGKSYVFSMHFEGSLLGILLELVALLAAAEQLL